MPKLFLHRKFAIVPYVVLAVLTFSCTSNTGLPEVGSQPYVDFSTAFYTGLAGLQVGEDVRALEGLTRATQLAPGEPAAWADLGILQLRQQQTDAAFDSLEKARSLAPDNSHIEALLGAIESKRGKVPESLEHFKKSVSLDSQNVKAMYSLAEELDRQALPSSGVEAQKLLRQILSVQSANIEVLLSSARLSAKQNDAAALKQSIETLQSLAATWPDPAKQQLASIAQLAASNPPSAAVQVVFLRNLLARDAAYRQSLNQVKVPATYVAEPFTQLLRLPAASSQPAAPDQHLQFESKPLAGVPQTITWLGAITLDDQSNPSVLWADATALHLASGTTLALPAPPNKNSIAAADLNYDFKTDLIIATAKGVRLYQQTGAQIKLPAAILNGNYTGAWAFDIDLDGDLDIILGTPQGEPVVLRNNGDGTFLPIHPFPGVDGLSAFAAADIDGDGDPDVALIDRAGKLAVFENQRLGNYLRRDIPGVFLDVASADINADGRMDFVLLRNDFAILRLTGNTTTQIARATPSAGAKLLLADVDNNGAVDLIVGNQVFLSDGKTFAAIPIKLNAPVSAVADLNQDGRLDLLALNANQAEELTNHGSKNYHWQVIRTRAASTKGDQRINSFGIGGEIEIRSGLLTQKQIINAPLLHFGLGENTKVDFARIVWPNGSVQAEFALTPNTTVLAVQRLKGSCPFLFAWNGKQFEFVKDTAPWSPALGLHINAQQVAGIYQTQEWFKIPATALAAHDGSYELRVTGEYWETFYIDHYSLMVVDHPAGTQVFTDERFAVPPPALKLYVTKDPKPFARATDNNGQDVSATVRNLDAQYLDNFGRGQYQGVTNDHWVELELPAAAPTTGPLYLIAHGWMHPTDATTNVALGQNHGPQPQGLSIEIPDGHGHWVTARKGLGFPAGRLKTIVLDLADLGRHFRLRANLEIYWDQLEWAPGLNAEEQRSKNGTVLAHTVSPSPGDPLEDARGTVPLLRSRSADSLSRSQAKSTPLSLSSATLHYRGFSQISQANISSPELPNYNILAETGQKWRDMQGYYTRYGDVRELLEKIDDRMVIMNAGDELQLKFPAQPPVAQGWTRDYIMVGDGWIKDGDYNSTFSETVLPLPYHGMKDYATPPKTLEQDPAYRLHPADWRTFHTRYITPNYFLSALWSNKQ